MGVNPLIRHRSDFIQKLLCTQSSLVRESFSRA